MLKFAKNSPKETQITVSLLGHTKITTTQIYCKVLDEGRRKAIDAMPDV